MPGAGAAPPSGPEPALHTFPGQSFPLPVRHELTVSRERIRRAESGAAGKARNTPRQPRSCRSRRREEGGKRVRAAQMLPLPGWTHPIPSGACRGSSLSAVSRQFGRAEQTARVVAAPCFCRRGFCGKQCVEMKARALLRYFTACSSAPHVLKPDAGRLQDSWFFFPLRMSMKTDPQTPAGGRSPCSE